MGDPGKLVLLEAILDVIQRDNLLNKVAKVGDYMLDQLRKMEKENSTLINSSRGRGTFIAFDCASSKLRESVVEKLLARGSLSKFKTKEQI